MKEVATIHGYYQRQATPEVWAELDALRERGAEDAKTIEYLRGLIAELERRVAEDDARWSQITIRAVATSDAPIQGHR